MVDRPTGIQKNVLLLSLSPADFSLLEPQLQFVELDIRFRLEECNKPISHAYFPESGIASVVANGRRNREIEVGIIGREGMTGINLLLGNDRSPNVTFMQVAGRGHRITSNALRAAMDVSHSMRQCFLHFVQTFMVQTSHTALAYGQGKLEERLARWLLMAHDRLDGDDLPLTHEFLALMLSVRRPGVTLALQFLVNRSVISSKRGVIVIQDREGLKKIANGMYGIPEAEYHRLIGKLAKS